LGPRVKAAPGQTLPQRRAQPDGKRHAREGQPQEQPAQITAARGEHDPEDGRAEDAEDNGRERGPALPGAERRGECVEIYRGQSSKLEKKYGISNDADSGESEPCTAFASMDVAKSLRIVPAAAFAGSVAPIRSRHLRIASSPSRTMGMHGP